MIRFSIGLSLFVISIIVGLSQYFDNIGRHENAQARYRATQQQVKKQGQFSERLERTKKFTLDVGEDQKARLQQALGLDRLGLDFKFTSNVRVDEPANRGFYRHEFEITGYTTYFDIVSLLGKIAAKSGFIINSVCIQCEQNTNEKKEDNTHAVRIRGFINVFNQATL